MGFGRPQGRWLTLAGALLVILVAGAARAAEPEVARADTLPDLGAAPALGGLEGRPVTDIEVVTAGNRWAAPIALRRVRRGDPLSAEMARRALRELTDSGRFADVRAEAEALGTGARLRLVVTPRRIVAAVKISGSVLSEDDVRHAVDLDVSGELTAARLAESAQRLRAFYDTSGFPHAEIAPDAIDTDDPLRVVVVFHVTPGAPRLVTSRVLLVFPPPDDLLREVVTRYGVAEGDRADEESLTRADRDLKEKLRKSAYFEADVAHALSANGDRAVLTVTVQAGPRVKLRFEGNGNFDAATLEDALDLDTNDDRNPAALAARLEKFYVERGFYDAHVAAETRGRKTDVENELVFSIREGSLVRVALREFPCLVGERTPDDAGQEIDSFLSEALPGTGFVGAVDPRVVDSALGPRNTTGARVVSVQSNPWTTYVPEVYERGTRHLQELYRSEGYLSATVGPVVLMRRACAKGSPAGVCLPVGAREHPVVACPRGNDLPVPDENKASSCVPDRKRGIRCEPDVALHIPIKLGPRAVLWDVAFEGNRVMVESELTKLAELDLGAPVSQAELEKARRRVVDEYQERGFAFVAADLRLELSPDHTRARARFLISEREQVRVKDVLVRGARRTNEGLILGRVAFERGDLYRRSSVRSTEERLATLGVFSSVTVALEDPEVFAKEKVVVITVRELDPQRIETSAGLSTGDGVRGSLEYSHRNVLGRAVKFTVRVQLGLLPDFLIFDPVVKRRFGELDLSDRLERRDTISLEFPEIGLGPLFPFGIDLVDVRDNSRDFGLTKQAGILTLSYRPTTRFVSQVGGSLERNDAKIFDQQDINEYLQQHSGQALRLRVPDGTTLAVAQRASITWDRRDNSFDATRGTFAFASIEHVRAEPIGNGATITSNFFRLTSRVAGYVRLSERGLAIAMSMRWGYNVQLRSDSQTYPDRLFYFGGGDSIRGFLQDSVIPEDIAHTIIQQERQPPLPPKVPLTADQVAIRGGNFLLNPRAELRIPLVGVLQTALFVDAGNLWFDPRYVNPFQLRYAAGTGLRATTPVGPLALDIGMNLARRPWEDPFAFHFSIGLF